MRIITRTSKGALLPTSEIDGNTRVLAISVGDTVRALDKPAVSALTGADIQAELDAVATTGGTVYLPRLGVGECLLSAPLEIPNNVTMSGVGTFCQTGYHNDGNYADILGNQPTVLTLDADCSMITLADLATPANWEVKNLCLFGDRANRTGTLLHAINLPDDGVHATISRGRLTDLLIIGVKGFGYFCGDKHRELLHQRISMLDCEAGGWYIQGTDMVFVDCWAGFCDGDGFAITGAGNNRFTRVDSWNHGGSGVYIFDTFGHRFTQLQTNSNNQHGVKFGGSAVKDVRISDWQSQVSSQQTANTFSEMYVNANSREIVVQGGRVGIDISATSYHKAKWAIDNLSSAPSTVQFMGVTFYEQPFSNGLDSSGKSLLLDCPVIGATTRVICQGRFLSGSGSPAGSVTPRFVADEYLDESAAVWYKAAGATSADWKALN